MTWDPTPHPLYVKGGIGVPTLPGSVLVVLYQPGQAKVSDLAHQVVTHEDVSGSQVPVDVVHPLDESHTVSDLRTNARTMFDNISSQPPE